jgi:hypothetical protein
MAFSASILIVPGQYFQPARVIVVCESMLRAVSSLWRLCKVDMDVFLSWNAYATLF